MVYLEPGEYARFGLDDETGDSLVVSASAMIDAFCRRQGFDVKQYTERLRFAPCGRRVMVSATPVVNVVSARVRAERRRTAMFADAMEAAVAAFGLEGSWANVAVEEMEVSALGEISFAAQTFGAPWTEAEVVYTAGWETVPDAVKVACAQVVRNAQAMPALNVKRTTVDAMQMEYFSGALLDEEVKRMLRPFVATRLG
ncbi:MAG: hypothetical protein JSS87_01840 [Acidobacteria bacterium]|nr:hypothetical protein [Acidobacteriota bacterium]